MNDAWNHALLVICLFGAWTAAVAYMGGASILWNFDQYKEKE